jgi:uncharacterized protein
MIAQLTGGALLGLAGALHCAAMCGGIGSGAALMFAEPSSRHKAWQTIALLSLGRISVYALLGGGVALFADLALRLSPLEATGLPLQWIGAASLLWIGFSTAGVLPAFSGPSNGSSSFSLASITEKVLAPLRSHPVLGPLGIGMVWGLAPCPLIYAALFTAGLTGSFTGGALWMLGFGLGTLPALVLAMFGIRWLSDVNLSGPLKMAAGLAIVLFAMAVLFLDLPIFSALCL